MNDNNQEEDYSNPDDFSYSQLFQLLGLNYDSDGEDPYGNLVTPQVIKSSSEERILQFQNAGNKQLESFFVAVEDKMLQEYKTDWGENDIYDQYHDNYNDSSNLDSVSSEEDNMEEINQVEDETNEMEKQEEEGDDGEGTEEDEDSIGGFGAYQPNNIQSNKITSRYDQTEVLEGDHPVMERNTLGVNNTKTVPITQGTLNPSLRNTKTQIVNINSTYRDYIFPPSSAVSSSSGFTITLSDPLYKVLEIKLSTYTIPYCWYNINKSNNYFYLDVYDSTSDSPSFFPLPKIEIPVGNYSASNIYEIIGKAISESSSSPALNFTITQSTVDLDSSSPSSNTGKTKIVCTSAAPQANKYRFRFFEESSLFSQSKYNHNLGWILGFRGNTSEDGNYGKMVYLLKNDGEGIVSESTLDIHGPRHFTLCLDDFCNTQMSNHVVGTTHTDNNVQMPSYWNTDTQNIECVDKKVSFVREVPRKLTNAQLFTMNTISSSDQATLPSYDANSSSRLTNPSYSNALAVIPVDTSSLSFGSTIMREAKTSTPRVYFGPVSIDRLRVKLQDDQGNQVDMNNRDWSFTLLVTSLYQY